MNEVDYPVTLLQWLSLHTSDMINLIICVCIFTVMFMGTVIVRLISTIKRLKNERDETRITFEREIMQMKKEVAQYIHLNKRK